MMNVMKNSFSFPPKSGEEITMRITNRPFPRREVESGKTTYVVLAQLYKLEQVPAIGTGREIILNRRIYKGMLAELKKNNISIDENLECLTKVWTITGIEWKGEIIHRTT